MPIEPPDGEKIAVLMPITSPSRLNAGPPVAAIDRRIDLQEVVIQAIADIAAAGRDNAGGDGAAKPERVADGDHPVADARLLRREIDIGKALVASTLSSARSVFGSVPMIRALNSPSLESLTVTSLAPFTTWLLVTT